MLHPEDQALFPLPRSIHHRGGATIPRPTALTCRTTHVNQAAAESFRRGFVLTAPLADRSWTPAGGVVIDLHPLPDAAPEAYRISVLAEGIRIAAADAPGFQYAGTTLGQLLARHPDTLPVIDLDDAPAFARRGFMLDISRTKVPTMATLFALVDQLAAWKFNHLQLYTEHTFAYAAHPDVWRDASPMTADEVRQLDARCRRLHIELSANQNSFGHLHRWLSLPAYRDLAESPDGYTTPWGERRTGPFSLNPLDPRSLTFLESLYDELFPNFTSPWVNIGGDETFDLGQGASKAACETRGKGRVYLDFLKQIHRRVEARGRRMMFWADIVLNHPEVIPELPRDLRALVWGYEATDPLPAQCATLAASGIPFWVCPGTSTWNSIAGRFDNAWTNIDTAATAGRTHGAEGLLLTEWGDNGHWQTQPFSRLALALGAGAAWTGRAPPPATLHQILPHAETLIDLGRCYLDAGFPLHNTSPLFPLLRFQQPVTVLDRWTPERLHAASDHLDRITATLPTGGSDLEQREIRLAAGLLRHAVQRGLALKQAPGLPAPAARRAELAALLAEHEHLWLARNRPGGLPESIAPLQQRLAELS
ncbi:MAG TPA: family 20 glycosylhydrolase [Kiritimatiellia bacterium]|nr:family 20 glycosylhydrolase [Kiritimatiellia bacterium]HMP33112.1 family 20 glycosylhydrolase [Kiritimatiellia bacterium]